MHKFIHEVEKDNRGEVIGCTYNEMMFGPIIEDLARNNTAFPAVTKVIHTAAETKVFFADHTAVTVKRYKEDADNLETAITFAIVKRLFGVPDKNGWVNDHSAKNALRRIIQKKLVDTVKIRKDLGRDKKKDDKKAEPKNSNKKIKKAIARSSNGRFAKTK